MNKEQLRRLMNTPEVVESCRQSVVRLAGIAREWRQTGQTPAELGVLSSGEYVSVCLATSNYALLTDPLRAFLLLDDWLQKWVLKELGLETMIGTVVGGVGLRS